MNRKFREIDRNRRCFLSMAALTLAAAQFGLARPASTQSKTAGPPASNAGGFFPGFWTEMIETNGTTIHVLRKGAGRPLLLLHGYPETHLTWHKVAPQLAEQFSVVVPDLRGDGDSGKPQDRERHENYSFRAMAQDQVDVMRHYGHERFLVVAHDRGARVAHRLCLDHPEMVEKACLMDIAPTLTMYRGTNQEFATRYMWWFFLIQASASRTYDRTRSGVLFAGAVRGSEQDSWSHCAGGDERIRTGVFERRCDPRLLQGFPGQRGHRPGNGQSRRRGRKKNPVPTSCPVGRKGNCRRFVGRTRCLAREVRHIGDGKGTRLRSLSAGRTSSGSLGRTASILELRKCDALQIV
jgi:pimeloyl-ACP methyl ester carboxylesterase